MLQSAVNAWAAEPAKTGSRAYGQTVPVIDRAQCTAGEAQVLDAPVAVADDLIVGGVLVEAPARFGGEPVDPLGAARGAREVKARVVGLAPQVFGRLAP